MANLSAHEFQFGDIVWSRINGSSWWPLQVVDENCVACKPKKRKNGLVLIRLYGTFEHIYVEPSKCVLKIDNCREVLQNSLDEDLALMKQGIQPKERVFQLKENGMDEPPEGKRQRKGKLKRTLVAEDLELADSCEAAKDLKAVMENDMNAVVADGIASEEGRENAELKMSNRIKTFKAGNAGKSGIEVSWNSRQGKQDCVWNHMNKDTEIESSDTKSIKQLVTKIVKEAAAENAKKPAVKDNEEECVKGTSEILYITDGCIDVVCEDKIAGQSDMQKPFVSEKASNGECLIKITSDSEVSKQDLEYCNAERTKCATFDASNPTEAKQACMGSQGTVVSSHSRLTRSKSGSRANSVKQGGATNRIVAELAKNGEQRGKVMKQDASKEKIPSPVSIKCTTVEKNGELSMRSRRVMQSLGLIAPSGSPFRRNGLLI